MKASLSGLPARFVSAADRINRAAGLGAGLVLLAMVGIISREAIGRYFFNAPTDWSVELSGYLLVTVVFMSGGFILSDDAHLRVDVFYARFLPRTRAWVDLFGYALGLVYLGFLLWHSSSLAWNAFLDGERSMIMRWSLYLPELAVPVGVALMLLQLAAQAVRAVHVLGERALGGPRNGQERP